MFAIITKSKDLPAEGNNQHYIWHITFASSKSNLNQIKPIDPTTNSYEIQRSEEHLNLYHGDSINKIQIVRTSPGKMFVFFQKINYENKKMEEFLIVLNILKDKSINYNTWTLFGSWFKKSMYCVCICVYNWKFEHWPDIW